MLSTRKSRPTTAHYMNSATRTFSEMAPLLSYCIDRFGPERCMFESNFQVDKVSISYPVLFNAFRRFSLSYSAAEHAALFHDTAARAYQIGEQ